MPNASSADGVRRFPSNQDTSKPPCVVRFRLQRHFKVMARLLVFEPLQMQRVHVGGTETVVGINLNRLCRRGERLIRVGLGGDAFNRHFPDNLQIRGDCTQTAPPMELFSSTAFRIARFLSGTDAQM